MSEPLVREEGRWEWVHEAVDVEPAGSPTVAVERGVRALRLGVEEGELSVGKARDVAMEARFALGAQEHHLGGEDAGAFEALEAFERELSGVG